MSDRETNETALHTVTKGTHVKSARPAGSPQAEVGAGMYIDGPREGILSSLLQVLQLKTLFSKNTSHFVLLIIFFIPPHF